MAGLYSRLNENGLAVLRKGLTWRGIVTPVISSSYENAPCRFFSKSQEKKGQSADLFSFFKDQNSCATS
jgi:hypothetical protein